MSDLEPCTYSQAQAVESSPTSSLATNQLQLLNGSHTHARSCVSALPMDGSPICECMSATSECSIHPSTKEKWIAFMQGSLAKILALQEIRLALQTVRAADYTEKSFALPMRYDLAISSWKTSQPSLLETMEPCSEQSLPTLPKGALMLSGIVYPLPKLVLPTKEIGGGVLPSLVRSDATVGAVIGKGDTFKTTKNGNLRKFNSKGTNGSLGLARHVMFFPKKNWPTPTASDIFTANLKSSQQKEGSMHSVTLPQAVKMYPTPRANQAMSAEITKNTATHKHPNLENVIARTMFPTPSACDHKGSGKNGTVRDRLDYAVEKGETKTKIYETIETQSGALNPTWVEWLMLWPIHWTLTTGFKPKRKLGAQHKTKTTGQTD